MAGGTSSQLIQLAFKLYVELNYCTFRIQHSWPCTVRTACSKHSIYCVYS